MISFFAGWMLLFGVTVPPKEKRMAIIPTHIAKPVHVNARAIYGVVGVLHGAVCLTLEDGGEFIAPAEMISRYRPRSGDYLVKQEDGYVYVNPKDVFERKYAPI